METIKYYFYYLSHLFTGFPLVVQIALVLIFLMGLLYLISWFSIGNGFYRKRIEEKRQRSLEETKENINHILLTDSDFSEDEIHSRLDLNFPLKKWKTIYLSEHLTEMIDLHEVNEHNLASLIKIMNLPEYWESQLENGDAIKRWKAIRMLDSMSDFVPASIISKQATLRRKDVGKYAKSVFTKFESHDAFRFLEDEIDDDLTELDKLRIHNSLKERSAEEVLPHLLRTILNTSNEDYQVFLIKEIGLLGKTEGIDVLMDLYKNSSNPEIKAEIVQTFSSLKYEEAMPVFIKDYNFVKPMVQEKIIEAAGKIGGKESIDFLEKIYYQTPNKEMLIKILLNIYAIDGMGTSVFKRLKAQNENNFNHTVFAFVESQYS